jgi:hypothetical protein
MNNDASAAKIGKNAQRKAKYCPVIYESDRLISFKFRYDIYHLLVLKYGRI